jgi:hypothetical protein
MMRMFGGVLAAGAVAAEAASQTRRATWESNRARIVKLTHYEALRLNREPILDEAAPRSLPGRRASGRIAWICAA